MTTAIRWGILGTGSIAHGFANGLKLLDDATVAAVASRSLERAQAFSQDYADQDWSVRAHGDYAALIADASVDVVYIATTHQSHVALARMAVEHGKPVLIEKPVGLHAAEVAELFALARDRGVFCMEAMWTRFLPAIQDVQRRLAAGEIGDLRLIQADFGIDISSTDPTHRMLDPAKGGGALWDLGVYPLTFARLLTGQAPSAVHAVRNPAPETGVDQASAFLLQYPQGLMAQLFCSFRLRVPHQARLHGSAGSIVINDFFHPQGFCIQRHGESAQDVSCPFDGPGYQFEAAEVQRCLRAGMTQSPACPLDETLEIITCMDQLACSWGVAYPPSQV